MTEAEAKQKWCPMVQFAIGPDNGAWQNVAYTNRANELDHEGTCCLGPDCMAWKLEVGESGLSTNGKDGMCGLVK